MKISRKHIAAFIMALSAMPSFAQDFNSGYFTDQFIYRHDENPAFGNDQGYFSVPMVGNVNVKTMANFGVEDVIYDNPMYPNQSNKKKTTFLNPYIEDGLSGFNKDKNRLNGKVNISILSMGFKGFGGYNTIELNSRTVINGNIPYEFFAFAKNTGNKRYEIGDIDFAARSFAELSFGHSHQINDRLRIGAKFKLLFGLGDASVSMKNVVADLSDNNTWQITADAKANVSVKGFKYESEQKEYEQRQGTYTHVNDVDIDGYGLSGFGMGVDLGAEYKINDSWKVSAALLDLGFINWSNNMYATNGQKTFTFDGFHDVDVDAHSSDKLSKKSDEYADQFSDFANLQDQGDQGSRSTNIGATLNVGCQYTLPAYKKLSFGLLSTTRIDGDYSWTEGRLSANIAPLKWLDGGVNFAVNTFTTSMGWIVNIHPKGFNLFVGMDHVLGKCSKEFVPLNSNASLTMGLNITW